MVDIGMVEIGLQDESLVDHIGRQVLHWIVGYSTAWYATLSHCDLVDNFKKVDSGAKILLQGLGVKTGHNDDEDDDEAEYGEEEYDEVVQEGGAEGEVRRVVRQRRRIRRAAARGFVNRYHPLVEYGERNFENLMLADLMENCERGIPIEMFNVLAPFHQNSAGAAGAGVAAAAAGGQNVRLENMQVTQPCSGPSSPTIASPGALSSTSFCLANGGGIGSVLGSGGCSVISSTTAADTADPNWQANKSTVRERNAAMFNNDLMADIRFIVGSDEQVQTIPAHKYVLATGSSVFYAMFYGGLAENKQEIKVPDVEPGAFLTLLKYLYCDEIQLEADNVLATLYVAKKYIVPHLARACVNYLETSLTAKNACLLLSQSRLFEEPELMQRCWEVIDAQVCCDSTITTNNTTTTTTTTFAISSNNSSRSRSYSTSSSLLRPVDRQTVASLKVALGNCSISMPSSPTNHDEEAACRRSTGAVTPDDEDESSGCSSASTAMSSASNNSAAASCVATVASVPFSFIPTMQGESLL